MNAQFVNIQIVNEHVDIGTCTYNVESTLWTYQRNEATYCGTQLPEEHKAHNRQNMPVSHIVWCEIQQQPFLLPMSAEQANYQPNCRQSF